MGLQEFHGTYIYFTCLILQEIVVCTDVLASSSSANNCTRVQITVLIHDTRSLVQDTLNTLKIKRKLRK